MGLKVKKSHDQDGGCHGASAGVIPFVLL